MKVSQLFKNSYELLKKSGQEHPHLEASWIVERLANITTVDRIRDPDLLITPIIEQQVIEATKRRVVGEPLAYILNEREFYSLKFYVDANVLIPRPETELLVDWGLQQIDRIKKRNSNREVTILDLGSGSGCIGLALLANSQGTRLSSVDISKPALAITQKNAKSLNLDSRMEVIHLDAAHAGRLIRKYDLVVANPPYIDFEDAEIHSEVKKHEPHEALFSAGGLQHISQWLRSTPSIVNDVCSVGFEVGMRQGDQVLKLFEDLQIFGNIYGIKDYSGKDRFVCGER